MRTHERNSCISPLAFHVDEPLGRRRELMLGAALYAAGSLISVVAPSGDALALASLGRGVYGVGIGFSMHAAPVYIAEIAPAHTRGRTCRMFITSC